MRAIVAVLVCLFASTPRATDACADALPLDRVSHDRSANAKTIDDGSTASRADLSDNLAATTTVTDPLERVRTVFRDERDQIVAVREENDVLPDNETDPTRTVPRTVLTTYKFDRLGQLVRVTDARGNPHDAAYDADGERTHRLSLRRRDVTVYTSRYHQLRNGALAMNRVFAGSERVATVMALAPSAGPGGFAGLRDTLWYHTDHLQSTNYVTDTRGRVTEHLEYFPFGEQWLDENGPGGAARDVPYRFTGHDWDAESRLYYAGARYYDPRQGQWISADPNFAHTWAGAAGGGIETPVNLQRYSYVGQHPTSSTDRDGRCWILCPVIILGVLLGDPLPVNAPSITFRVEGGMIDGTATAPRHATPDPSTVAAAPGEPLQSHSTARQVLHVVSNVLPAGVGVARHAIARFARARATAAVQHRAATLATAEQTLGAREGTATVLTTSSGHTYSGLSTSAASGAGVSQPATNATVQSALDAVPVGSRSHFHGCCGEMPAYSAAINAGENLEGAISASAVVRRPDHAAHATARGACASCGNINQQFGVNRAPSMPPPVAAPPLPPSSPPQSERTGR